MRRKTGRVWWWIRSQSPRPNPSGFDIRRKSMGALPAPTRRHLCDHRVSSVIRVMILIHRRIQAPLNMLLLEVSTVLELVRNGETCMSNTDLTAMQRLQQAGLQIKSFGSTGTFANGYAAWDPLADDMSTARIYPLEGRWIFEVWEYTPGPGPGDFQRFFDSLNEAIDAVLDYYFGDATMMDPQS